MGLVQIVSDTGRRVAVVEEPQLRLLANVSSVYELAQRSIRDRASLSELVNRLRTKDLLEFTTRFEGGGIGLAAPSAY